ncbi:MAG: cation:proton antiporter [Eubacteriales bacterium]|jgi:Kef-type K+ transport system membrane component KefB
MTGLDFLRWILALALAFLLGKLVTKLKLPSILGWLIGGMMLGPHALALLPQHVLDNNIYKIIITWMQVSFGLMLGTELIIRKIKSYGKALMITTLTQSLGTFLVVSFVFAVVFMIRGIPVYLAFAFGGIALATAPAPALSIVQEFHTRGPVTDTLLPMAVLDDITCTAIVGILLNRYVFTTITLNYMLMGVSASAVFSNMITEEQLDLLISLDQPILGISLLGAIVDLGAPLNYHLIIGAGLYTFVYIGARAFGKYFGARIGATATHMPKTVQRYLGLTLLPHSGVSLVFTGIICGVLQGSRPDLAAIVQGTIAAAAVINEIIAVIAAKKGFELAGEIGTAAKPASASAEAH